MAGGRTVFEFTGSEADREHRGSRGTFMGATLDLSHAKEERETALRSGPSSWIFGGFALLLVGGITAYMVTRSDPKPAEDAAAVAETPAAVAAPETKAAGSAGDETGGGSGDETAGGPAAADAKAPEDAKAVPAADAPKPAEPAVTPPVVEPPKPEPAKPSGGTSKPSGGTSKPSGGKSTGTKKPAPKEEPKPTGGTKLKPKKPPRDPLGNLPPPP